MADLPARGEIWHAFFEPVQGREQGRDRPCLIISTDALNHGPGDLLVVLPITSTRRNTPFHIPVEPPDGGLPQLSFIMCEQIRAVSINRVIETPLVRRYGTLSEAALRKVEDRVRIVLELHRR